MEQFEVRILNSGASSLLSFRLTLHQTCQRNCVALADERRESSLNWEISGSQSQRPKTLECRLSETACNMEMYLTTYDVETSTEVN